MHPKPQSRYKREETLTSGPGGRTRRATDRLTGASIIIKERTFSLAQHELRRLLALPAGLGPCVLDVLWPGSGRFSLVLEDIRNGRGPHVRGGDAAEGNATRSLAEGLDPRAAPAIAQGIAQCLLHLHRAGWVHGDLKPAHVFLRQAGSVRLIDFGYTFDRFGGEPEQPRGGTPAYLAPELTWGWTIDGRADLFALGVALDQLLPASRDAKWEPIIARLTARLPRERYASAFDLRQDLARVFHLAPHPDRFAVLGGRLRGRRELVAELLSVAVPGARLLVQARPGVGLSRFLAESVLALAEKGGPPACTLDLSGWPAHACRSAVEWASRLPLESVLLLGVDDPSPGLLGLDRDLRAELRSWPRIHLPPLDPENLCDLVMSSLCAGSPKTREVVEEVALKTEGDLTAAGSMMADLLRRFGIEVSTGWEIDPRALDEVSRWTEARPRGFHFSELKRETASSLALCARAGPVFSESLAMQLLAQFGRKAAVPHLRESGLLARAKSSGGEAAVRLRFATMALWREARDADVPDGGAAEHWLNGHQTANPADIDEVLAICRRARRLGDHSVEAGGLAEAIRLADQHRRRSDLLRLLAYPADPPRSMALRSMFDRVRDQSDLLESEFSYEELLVLAGHAVGTLDPALADEFYEKAASGTEASAAAEALIRLAERSASRSDDPRFDARIEGLKRFEDERGIHTKGARLFLEAQRSYSVGNEARALALARDAELAFPADQDAARAWCRQFLSVLTIRFDPGQAMRWLESALESAHDPELAALVRNNLAILCARRGACEEALRWAEKGLRGAGAGVSGFRVIALRQQRAWSLADLGQIEVALAEARELLALDAASRNSLRLVPSRLLVGVCRLHQGLGRVALREMLEAWREAAGEPARFRGEVLALLLDAVLDLEALQFLRDNLWDLRLPPDSPVAEVQSARVRLQALRAMSRGRVAAAAKLLERNRDLLGGCDDLSVTLSYTHHLALAWLGQTGDRKAAERAAALFREVMDLLPNSGHGYRRGRALLGLALALAAIGDRSDSRQILDAAAKLAGDIQARGLLADVLAAQGRLELGAARKPAPKSPRK